jgi:hypothetical protein
MDFLATYELQSPNVRKFTCGSIYIEPGLVSLYSVRVDISVDHVENLRPDMGHHTVPIVCDCYNSGTDWEHPRYIIDICIYSVNWVIVISFLYYYTRTARAGVVAAIIVVTTVVIPIVLCIAIVICVIYCNRNVERNQQRSFSKLHTHALCKIIAVHYYYTCI